MGASAPLETGGPNRRLGVGASENLMAEGESRPGARSNGGGQDGSTEGAEFFGCSEPRENAAEISNKLDGTESSLRRVIDTIPALAWCARPDGSIEFLNRQWHDYTGLSPAETIGWGYQAAFHPEDRKNGPREMPEAVQR